MQLSNAMVVGWTWLVSLRENTKDWWKSHTKGRLIGLWKTLISSRRFGEKNETLITKKIMSQALRLERGNGVFRVYPVFRRYWKRYVATFRRLIAKTTRNQSLTISFFFSSSVSGPSEIHRLYQKGTHNTKTQSRNDWFTCQAVLLF